MKNDHIFGFKGNEFYLKPWPSLAGRSWGEVCAMFPDAVPIGLNRAGARPGGGVEKARPHELHGIGLGALPHLLFFEQFRDRTLILVELPNSGHWHYQQENASPSSLRSAIRELFTRLDLRSSAEATMTTAAPTAVGPTP